MLRFFQHTVDGLDYRRLVRNGAEVVVENGLADDVQGHTERREETHAPDGSSREETEQRQRTDNRHIATMRGVAHARQESGIHVRSNNAT